MALEQVDYIDVRLESAELPPDSLQIHKLRGREAISQPFSFDLEVVCLDPDGLDPEQVVGAEVTIVFERPDEELRRVHGVIWELSEQLDPQVEFKTYHLKVVPRALRLSLVATQEVFLELSVPQIIEQKLQQVGLSGADYELRLQETYPVREFVVQYNETDLAFVSRLAEHLGISYFFEHESGVDRMIFVDQQTSFTRIEPAVLRPRGERLDVYRLDVRTRMIPATYVCHDYNYRTPQVDLLGRHELPVGAGGIVEYGGHFKTVEEGTKLAQVRAEERQVERRVYTGESILPRFAAGHRVSVDGVRPPELLLVEVEHVAERPVLTHGGDSSERHYQNTFRAIPEAHTYRPPRVTPRPRINGLLNAVVEHGIQLGVGRWSQLDEWGRYTVRFLCDTADHGQKQSRWCRMLQPHAGTSYGMRFPLKPGTEVLVGFVDGDPDRPVIVGATFRPDTPSPVTLSNAVINKLKTESGILIELRDA